MKSPLLHLIFASLACVAMLVGYGVWYASVKAKSVAVANLENQISIKTETESRITSTRASLAEIAGDEATLQSYFVPETGVVAFIDHLDAQGQTLGATVSVLSVATSDAGAQPELTLTLTVEGTFDAVMRTIGAIEYAPYDLSISRLSLQQSAKNTWHADLNLHVGSVPASAHRVSIDGTRYDSAKPSTL